MSIKYDVLPIPFKEGLYYPRPVSKTTQKLDAIIKHISYSTTLTSSDVEAVLDALRHEITTALLSGHCISLGKFLELRPRMVQKLKSEDEPFDPEAGGKFFVSAFVKRSLTRRIRTKAQFERVATITKKPSLHSFEDARSRQKGVYTSGGNARIKGTHLKIFDEELPHEGVFFISRDGTERRVSVIQDNGRKRLTIEIPAGLSGTQRVEVRTRYTRGGTRRTGRLGDLLRPSESGSFFP